MPVAVLLAPSVAVHVTLVTPTGKIFPVGRSLCVELIGARQPLTGLPMVTSDTTAEHRPWSAFTVTSLCVMVTVFAPLLVIVIVPPIVPVANNFVRPQKSTRSELLFIDKSPP